MIYRHTGESMYIIVSIFIHQGFLPLDLDTPVSNCKAAVIVLVYPGYFISPVPTISGEHFPIRHRGRRPIED